MTDSSPTGEVGHARTGRGPGLARNSSGFLVAAASRQVAMFLALPFLTRAIDPAVYGEVVLATASASAAAAVATLGLETPVFRVWFRHDGQARARRLAAARGLLVASGVLVAAGGTALAFTGAAVDAWDEGPARVVVVAMAMVPAQTVFDAYVSPTLRAAGRLRAYVVAHSSLGLLLPVAIALAVIGLGGGAVGWLLAHTATIVVVASAAWWFVPRWPERARASDRYELLAESLPLVPHALSHLLLSLADRFVLAASLTTAAVGVYNLGYRAAQLVALVLTELNRAIMVEYGQALSLAPVARRRRLRALGQLQAWATAAVAIPAAAAGPLLFRLVFPSSYADGASIIPIVVLGYGFMGLYYVPVNLLSVVRGVTTWLWLGSTAAVVANLALNLALIPVLGLEGAAWATVAAFAVLLLATWVYASAASGEDVPLPPPALMAIAVVAVASFAVEAPVVVRGSTQAVCFGLAVRGLYRGLRRLRRPDASQGVLRD